MLTRNLSHLSPCNGLHKPLVHCTQHVPNMRIGGSSHFPTPRLLCTAYLSSCHILVCGTNGQPTRSRMPPMIKIMCYNSACSMHHFPCALTMKVPLSPCNGLHKPLAYYMQHVPNVRMGGSSHLPIPRLPCTAYLSSCHILVRGTNGQSTRSRMPPMIKIMCYNSTCSMHQFLCALATCASSARGHRTQSWMPQPPTYLGHDQVPCPMIPANIGHVTWHHAKLPSLDHCPV
ncbi:hypothetical protein TorRG33x02_242050 [Trema orientale]|uniref:Uncharacterized protein n=1 Tax=Trema orientale TaxID=63057 RepID=A0A2P5DU11_TREOI|nr:hypothetical protein TorRG33x02_242050 [Trema orientale]